MRDLFARIVPASQWFILCVIGVCLLTAAWVCFGLLRQAGKSGQTPRTMNLILAQPESGYRETPLCIEPLPCLPGALDEGSVRKAVARLQRQDQLALSDILHVLRLFGKNAPCLGNDKSGSSLLDVILDHSESQRYFKGRPALIDTREGVRCREATPREAFRQSERQSHHGQLLAVLAELQVPLNRQVSTAGGTRSVRAILEDTLANFNRKERELEWTAVALALYLPPKREWTDKYGNRHTLDEVAEEFLNRPLTGRASCAGTHLLHALVTLLRADQLEPVLSEDTRNKVRDYLKKMAKRMKSNQSSDGFWDRNWYASQESSPASAKSTIPAAGPEVLVTGHSLEWLLLLPRDLMLPEECFLRAARWLHVRLLGDSDEIIRKAYCPYSHAGRVLLLLTRPALAKQGFAPNASEDRIRGSGYTITGRPGD